MLSLVTSIWVLGALPPSRNDSPVQDTSLLNLSEQLLYAVKMDVSPDSIIQELTVYSIDDLAEQLSNDDVRKAFWINLYNAWYQILAIHEKMTNPKIFNEKAIIFSDHAFSLDDVEHGILRKYRWKYSLGYLPQFLPGRTLKKLAVSSIDYRIHFALNCGAKSCPPIAFYTNEKIEQQLELATRSFLASETDVDTNRKEVGVTRIMLWFKADFGGNSGIRTILKKYVDQNLEGFKIRFKEYDWSKELKNFTS